MAAGVANAIGRRVIVMSSRAPGGPVTGLLATVTGPLPTASGPPQCYASCPGGRAWPPPPPRCYGFESFVTPLRPCGPQSRVFEERPVVVDGDQFRC